MVCFYPTASLMALIRCHGIRPSRHLLVVDVPTQKVHVFQHRPPAAMGDNTTTQLPADAWLHYQHQKTCVASTSRFGVGQLADSNLTPLGMHSIARRIGGGQPIGTVFQHRKVIGYTWQGLGQAKIAHRILWLRGLEPGWNSGGNVDSFERYIYIHGTGDYLTLGKPSSCGCVHLSASDLLALFDRLSVGDLVYIQ